MIHSMVGCNAEWGPSCTPNKGYCDCACGTHHGEMPEDPDNEAQWIRELYWSIMKAAEKDFCNYHGMHPCWRCAKNVRHESLRGSCTTYVK